MDAANANHVIREAVGVFHDRDALQNAVEDLLKAGFDRSEISLLAGEQAVEQKLGHAYQKVQELEDDAVVPRAAFVGNHSLALGRVGMIGGLAYVGATVAAGAVVASGGALAATIVAAVLAGGGGGLLGGWAARLLGRDRAETLRRQLDHGGLLLWVGLRDEAHERRALAVLKESGADDVHVHEMPASELPAENPLSGVTLDPFLPGSRI
jgi:hypothetical protein